MTRPDELYEVMVSIQYQGAEYDDPDWVEPSPEEIEKLKKASKGGSIEIKPPKLTPEPKKMNNEHNR